MVREGVRTSVVLWLYKLIKRQNTSQHLHSAYRECNTIYINTHIKQLRDNEDGPNLHVKKEKQKNPNNPREGEGQKLVSQSQLSQWVLWKRMRQCTV